MNPLAQSFANGSIERELQALMIQLYDESLKDTADEINLYGAPHLGPLLLIQLQPAAPFLAIGTGLILIGISVLLFIPLLKLAKVTGKLGKKTALWIKSWFVRRKKNA